MTTRAEMRKKRKAEKDDASEGKDAKKRKADGGSDSESGSKSN